MIRLSREPRLIREPRLSREPRLIRVSRIPNQGVAIDDAQLHSRRGLAHRFEKELDRIVGERRGCNARLGRV